ncbi:mechanosensitive ion channel family protein [Ancylobacter lacus]|nr:mechanosensitive ion channel family protein [Ancylobacter lacus]
MPDMSRPDACAAPVRPARPRRPAVPGRGFARLGAGLATLLVAFLLAFAAALPGAGPAFAQDTTAPGVKDQMEGQRAVVDSVEAALGRDGLRSIDLDELRARLDPVREALSNAIADLDPRVAELHKRIAEIGPKPAADAPPENPSVTAEREQLNARLAETDGVLKQARLLSVRADQLSDRIIGKRRALFTDMLFARSYSVLDPQLWIQAVAAIPVEMRGISYLLSDWAAYANARRPLGAQLAVLAGVIGLFAVAHLLARAAARPLRHFAHEPADEPVSRLRAAALCVLDGLVSSLPVPAATIGALALANAFDLVPPRINELSNALLLAVTVVCCGRGLARAALAPDSPRRRVLSGFGFAVEIADDTHSVMTDDTARLLYRACLVSVTILGVSIFLYGLHSTLVVPVPLTVATSALMSAMLALVAARTLRQFAVAEAEDGDGVATSAPAPAAGGAAGVVAAALQWVRLPFWLINTAVFVALAAGYVAFAAFLSSRALTFVVMLNTFMLTVVLINAVFIDSLQSAHRTRTLAKTLGVRPASLELFGVLVAGVLKLIAIVVTLVVAFGTFGTSTADMRDLFNRITFGFTIGNSTITLGDVMGAVMFLIIGFVIARAIQRWIASAILPRTSLESGLQNSIATIIGYVGSITVVAVAMGQLGINLENIALVAGALSVGIGFGLQSIVSNFVSGLILLAERPIRVGDMILVKGEEGYVRRISVRATEIETFDRAMVLIPNSDLITGMVKNFTHANTTGRVIVQVNVSYDSDIEQVRDLLIDCACDHPQVLRSPPPRVFLMKFGDSYLQFELRCVVANVDYALTVKSDLHFAVFDRLKANRIGIPYTPWSIYRGEAALPPAAAGD